MANRRYSVQKGAGLVGTRRYSRRTALGASALGLGGLSAFLAACSGSSNSNNGGSKPVASAAGGTAAARPSGSGTTVLTTPSAGGSPAAGASPATAAVKKGGTLQPGLRFYTNPIPTLDPQATNTSDTLVRSNGVYSYLAQTKPGKIETGVIEGDLATSWESSDQATWTVKLNQKAQFHPPLNRPLTSDDVVFSFNRITGKASGKPQPGAGQFANVDSISNPDASTVVYKLKTPDPYFAINILANNIGGQILPKEADTAFDPAQKMVGTGPWLFDSYETGSKLSFNRNPKWHNGPDLPYFDKVVCNVVQDATAKLNFFLSGQLDYIDARGVDLAPIGSAVKGAQPAFFSTNVDGWSILFQYKDVPANSPWLDVRVRQAVSMALDRDALFEAATQASLAKKAGFNIDTIWNGPIPCSNPALNLDPRKDLDAATAATFKSDPQGAKALLAAAGYANGFELEFERNKGFYGDPYDNSADLVPAMLNAIGIKVNVVIRDQPSWFGPKNQLGVFDQAQLYLGPTIGNSPVSNLIQALTPTGLGNTAHVNDPDIANMIQGLVGKDDATVTAGVRQIQIALAKKMYWVPTFNRLNYWVYQPKIHGGLDYYSPGGTYSDFGKNVVRYWRDA